MLRKALSNKIQDSNKQFRMRGHDVKRIETFSDAVFAFAVTLLIVSLEVPKNFEELTVTMRGFFAFGISFLFLMMIWYQQNIFFRRYGMDDTITVTLNCILIFVVLFYVYPLKFLFGLTFSNQIYGEGASPLHIKAGDIPKLMLIYSIGFSLIYLQFFFMHLHALKKRDALQLTAIEQFDTKTKIFSNLVLILISIISIFMSQLLPPASAAWGGMVYMLIAPVFYFYHSFRGYKRRKLFA